MDDYLADVRASLGDRGAARVLRIMHGVGTQSTGRDLYMNVGADLAERVESGELFETARGAYAGYLARVVASEVDQGESG